MEEEEVFPSSSGLFIFALLLEAVLALSWDRLMTLLVDPERLCAAGSFLGATVGSVCSCFLPGSEECCFSSSSDELARSDPVTVVFERLQGHALRGYHAMPCDRVWDPGGGETTKRNIVSQ